MNYETNQFMKKYFNKLKFETNKLKINKGNLKIEINKLKINTNKLKFKTYEIKKDKIIACVNGKEVATAYAEPGNTPENLDGMKFSSITEFYNYAVEIESFMDNYPFIASD